MSLPSAAPACQPQAHSTVSFPSSIVPATLPAQRSPVLHATAPEPACLWLPVEVVAQVIDALPVSSVPAASLVSKTWLEGADAARSAARMLRWMDDLDSGAVTVALFDQWLTQVAAFPPHYVVQGLCALARFQCSLGPQHREQAFRKLLAASSLCPAQHMVLCLLALSLAPGARSTPQDLEAVLLDMLLASARKLPVERQAMIVAALCGNQENLQGATKGFLAQIAGMVGSWPARELEQAGALFARTIRACVKSGPITPQICQQLGHLGFYRLPFMTSLFPGPKTAETIAKWARQILALDLEMEEKLFILAHLGHQKEPWLVPGWFTGAEQSGLAYLRAIQTLPLEQESMVALLCGSMAKGAPLLGRLFAALTDPGRTYRLVDITTLYIDEIVNSAVLAESAKVTLLRSRMKGLPHQKAAARKMLPRSVRIFSLGSDGDTPFSGMSIVDSLFADENTRVLHAYMLAILGSSLSDAAKCAVLRLDYPHRICHGQMNIAHEIYNDTVGSSVLSVASKQILRQDVRTLFDRSCLLI